MLCNAYINFFQYFNLFNQAVLLSLTNHPVDRYYVYSVAVVKIIITLLTAAYRTYQ